MNHSRNLLRLSNLHTPCVRIHVTYQLSHSLAQSFDNTFPSQNTVPIARNIYFSQCPLPSQRFASTADLSSFIDHEDVNSTQHLKTPLEIWKQKAKLARAKKTAQQLNLKNKYYGQSFNEAMMANADRSERRLVVILSWLNARDKHIEKYRQFYLDRGFDVLNVKTTSWDLILPNHGARKISEDFVRFLREKRYPNVVLHGFSVGGFMFARLLIELEKSNTEASRRIRESIKGLLFDSVVTIDKTIEGISRSFSKNPLVIGIISQLIKAYLVLGHHIATKHYEEASVKIWSGAIKAPSLFIVSKADTVCDHTTIEGIVDAWRSHGIDVEKFIVEGSPHVQIFSQHKEKYIENVERLLKKIGMT